MKGVQRGNIVKQLFYFKVTVAVKGLEKGECEGGKALDPDSTGV